MTPDSSRVAFVTGGSGFVGLHLIRMLVTQGWTVRALAISEHAAQEVESAGAKPVFGDINNATALKYGMVGASVVFHAAAHLALYGDRSYAYQVNVTGTEQLLQAALASGVKRFVHVSSEAVLAGGRPLIDVDESWRQPDRWVGMYPWSKALGEQRVLAANSALLQTIVVRPRLIWGPGDKLMLPNFVAAVRGGYFAWVDGGRYLTSTTHVENVCAALVLAAERGIGGRVYFVTDGEPLHVREFITGLLATQGLTPPERSMPRALAWGAASALESLWTLLRLSIPLPVTRTTVNLFLWAVTINDARIRTELGYKPVMTREEGLHQMTVLSSSHQTSPRGSVSAFPLSAD
jgi:nucleoside-diphosphate-sugar epimerase